MKVLALDIGREAHQYVVLDGITKDSLDAGSLPNKSWMFEALAAQIEAGEEKVRLCLECGNGLATPFEQFAISRGWEVVALDPKAVRSYRENVMGQPNKTDELDALAIALMGAEAQVAKRFEVRHQPRRPLRRITRDYESLVFEKTAIKNRLRAAIAEYCPELNKKVVPDLEAQAILWLLKHHPDPKQWCSIGADTLLSLMERDKLSKRARRREVVEELVELSANFKTSQCVDSSRFLLSEIKLLARRLTHLIQDADEAEDLIKGFSDQDEALVLLNTIVGVGPITGAKVMAEIQDISNFANESKLASYSGQGLKRIQTGKSYDFRRPQLRANRHLKNTFMQIAHNNRKFDERSRAYYEKKLAEGKTKLQAHRALARQLVRVVFAILKNNKPYVPTPKKESKG